MEQNEFFYEFNREETKEDVIMDGKYRVRYDTEEGRVYGIEVNVGLDCPQIWETIQSPSMRLYQACENDLVGRRVVI